MITITQLFGGERRTTHTHNVTSVAGLRRVLATYSMGEGWGVKVLVPRPLAARLGIYELVGGGLGVGSEPLVEGRIEG
jgi:hypothetical protein